MPKKYTKNYKSRRSSTPSKHTGRKILIGLLAAGVIAGIIATALHYSFENDKDQKPTSSPSRIKRALDLDYGLDFGLYSPGEANDLADSIQIMNFEYAGFYFSTESFRALNAIRGHYNMSGKKKEETIILPFKSETTYSQFKNSISQGESLYYFDEYDYQSPGIPVNFELNNSMGWFTFSIDALQDYGGWFVFTSDPSINCFTDNPEFVNTNLPLTDKVSSSIVVNYYKGYTLTEGTVKDIYINVDDRFSLEQIKTKIKAVDFYGIDVPFTLTSVEYALGSVGIFTATLAARDVYGNTVNATLKIHVSDYAKPTITLKSAPAYSYTKTVTLEEILTHFTLADNVGLASKQVMLNSEVILDSEGNTSYTFPAGVHKLALKATDTSGNSHTLNFDYKSIDDIAPTISSSFASDIHEISVINANNAFIEKIIGKYSAADDIDGAIAVTFSGTINNRVDDYFYTLTAVDKAGNKVNRTLTFKVKNDVKPYFTLEEDLYLTSIDNPLPSDAILTLILENESLKRDQVASYSLNTARYFSAKKDGIYPVDYLLDLVTGEKILNSINFSVVGEKDELGSPWDKFCNTISKGWREFWIRLGNLIRFRGWRL